MNHQDVLNTPWLNLPIECPHCRNHGDDEGAWARNSAVPFKLVEDVVRSFAFAAALDGDGVLSVTADVETDGVDWESGTGMRVECMECFRQFSLPGGAVVDFDS